MGNLPSFSLVRLLKFPINNLVSEKDSDLTKLMIVFSLVHNDLKDCLWFHELLGPAQKETSNQTDNTAGQIRGMRAHCIRMLRATFFEFLETFEENKKIINGNSFQSILKKLDYATRRQWKALLDLTKKGSSKKQLYNILREIRKNGTYHYSHLKKPFIGLQHYISKKFTAGFVSFGKNWEETRFYFADAAIQYYHMTWTDRYPNDFDKELAKYLIKISRVLFLLVQYYLINVLNNY